MMSTTAFSSTMKNASEQRDREHRRHVELADRLGGVLAHALQVEDRLGEDRAAAEHGAEVQPPQRDDRDHRVAQDVPDHDLALREPLGPRGAHVVLVDRVEHVRAQHARVEADEQDRQRRPRQDQVVEPVDRVLGELDVAAVGEPAELEAQVVVHQRPDPEHGHRDADQGDDREEAVRELPRLHRAVEPEADRDEHPQERRPDRERQGARQPLDDLLDHRKLREVRLRSPVKTFFIVVMYWTAVLSSKPHSSPDRLDLRLGRLTARHPHGRVAVRDHVEDQEREHRDGEHHEHHLDQPADDEARHPLVLQPDLGPRVERVAHAVAEHVQRQHGEHEHQRRARSSGAAPVAMRSMPSSIIVPHDGVGGRTPAPRNDSAASSRIALAISSVKKTSERRGQVRQHLREHDPQRPRRPGRARPRRTPSPAARAPGRGSAAPCTGTYTSPMIKIGIMRASRPGS